MTGLGEEVYEPATEACALVEKAARQLAASLFGTEDRLDFDGVSWLEIWDSPEHYADCCWKEWVPQARAALSSLGLPLPDLQWAAENAAVVMALREGRKIVRDLETMREHFAMVAEMTRWVAEYLERDGAPAEKVSAVRAMIPAIAQVDAAPKSPSEEV